VGRPTLLLEEGPFAEDAAPLDVGLANHLLQDVLGAQRALEEGRQDGERR
jgi:hypothetical protein